MAGLDDKEKDKKGTFAAADDLVLGCSWKTEKEEDDKGSLKG